jgi:hypothetical protein
MPHDRFDEVLKVGDVVVLPGVIQKITSDSPKMCNVEFLADACSDPDEYRPIVSCNSRSFTKVYDPKNEGDVLDLATCLHEAGREAVEKNLVVRRDVPSNGFIEWTDLSDEAREGRILQARWLLKMFHICDK